MPFAFPSESAFAFAGILTYFILTPQAKSCLQISTPLRLKPIAATGSGEKNWSSNYEAHTAWMSM
jgi:hypothetical protein